MHRISNHDRQTERNTITQTQTRDQADKDDNRYSGIVSGQTLHQPHGLTSADD